jgi:1-acyl-sn-glycerol-3-phosphate acyltransferase
MQTSKIQTYWLIFLTGIVTFYESFLVLLFVVMGICTRARIDKLTYRWSKKLLKIVKAAVEISDPYNLTLLENKQYIIMSNHLSHYDIPIIFTSLPGSIRMIAKSELFKIPILGLAMKNAEILNIDRNNLEHFIVDLRNARLKMLSGIIPWIAPEGTRSRSGQLQAFKKGGFLLAKKNNAVIIPVAIIGSNNILPPDTLNFGIGAHIKVKICQQIDTTCYKSNEVRRLMTDVRDSIADAINS